MIPVVEISLFLYPQKDNWREKAAEREREKGGKSERQCVARKSYSVARKFDCGSNSEELNER
jgi:hypothetical protein